MEKKLQSQTVSREKLHKTLWHKKAACKMLVKLTHCHFSALLNTQEIFTEYVTDLD